MVDWVVAVCGVVVSLVVPFVVSLCTSETMSANSKRWIAIVVSIIAGVATGIITGVPTPETFAAWCLATVGGVQAAYSLFKSIGVTSHALDALSAVGSGTKPDDSGGSDASGD